MIFISTDDFLLKILLIYVINNADEVQVGLFVQVICIVKSTEEISFLPWEIGQFFN